MAFCPNKAQVCHCYIKKPIGGVEEQVTLALRHLGGLHLCSGCCCVLMGPS